MTFCGSTYTGWRAFVMSCLMAPLCAALILMMVVILLFSLPLALAMEWKELRKKETP